MTKQEIVNIKSEDEAQEEASAVQKFIAVKKEEGDKSVEERVVRNNVSRFSVSKPGLKFPFQVKKRPKIAPKARLKPYKCTYNGCDKAFARSTDAKVHEAVHTGERRHVCPVCAKTFIQSSHMRMHLQTHNEEKSFVCTVCQKGFHRAINLKIHMQGRVLQNF